MIGVSLHVKPSGHPPLLIEHEYSQYAIPVCSHTLQIDPLGHSNPVQATMKGYLNNKNV